MKNAREAIALMLEVLSEQGQPLPIETASIVAEEARLSILDRAEDGLPLVIETKEVEVTVEVPV